MLGKLLKYDLKWIYKVVVVFYVLAFLFSVIGRCCIEIDQSLIFQIVGNVSFGIAISMMVSSLINCLMRAWARFVRNIYKDESYLTHTLPVSKKAIYLSKVLAAIISAFTTTVVIIACLFICYYSKSNLEFLKTTLEIVSSAYSTNMIRLLLSISFVAFLEIVFIILVGYVGIILGHQSHDHRMVKSIIIGFGCYLFTQVVTLLILFVFGLLCSDIMNLFQTVSIVETTTIKKAMLIGSVLYLFYIGFYYWFGQHKLEEGVNID